MNSRRGKTRYCGMGRPRGQSRSSAECRKSAAAKMMPMTMMRKELVSHTAAARSAWACTLSCSSAASSRTPANRLVLVFKLQHRHVSGARHACGWA